MSAKVQYALQCQAFTDALGLVADNAAAMEGLYFDRGYQFGGLDAITDEDISTTGLKAQDITNFITLVQEYQKFIGNQAVTTADYNATISAVRSNLPGDSAS